MKTFDDAMDELPLNAWNDLAFGGSIRSKWAKEAFSFSDNLVLEQWFADEAMLLQNKGFDTEAIIEYQYYFPLLVENPAIISYVRMMEDYGYEYPVPDLKNIFDTLNWTGQTQNYGAARIDLCSLLRIKLIEELRDVVSANELAMILDEHIPSSYWINRIQI